MLYPISLAFGAIGWFNDGPIGLDVAPGPDGRMTITRVQPTTPAWDSGAKPGDILLEVDGLEINETNWRVIEGSGKDFRISSAADGQVIFYSVEEERVLSGALILSLTVIGIVFALTSGLMFLRSNRSSEVLTLSILFLVVAISFAVVPAGARAHPWVQYVQLLGMCASAVLFFVFFSWVTPVGRAIWSLGKSLSWAFAITSLAIYLVYALSVAELTSIYNGARLLLMLQIGAGFIGGIIYLVASYWKESSPPGKEQLRIMVLGISIAILPFIILGWIPRAIGQSAVLPPEVLALFVVLVPVSFGYAILRHQFMGIRRLVHRGTAYALISLLVFAIYGGLIGILRSVGGADVSSNLMVQIILLVVLFVAVPSISGTRRLAFAAVDRLLYKEYIDHPDLTRRVSIGAAGARDVNDLANSVLGTIAQEL